MKYKLRSANQNDLEKLHRLESRAFTADRFTKKQIEYLLTQSRATTLVIELNNEIVASACLLWRKSSHSARLYNIAVDPDYQGEGLGLRLLNECDLEAARRGSLAMTLEVRKDNKGAIKFYEKHGFKFVRTIAGYYEDGSPALKMERPLKAKVAVSKRLDVPYYAQTLDFTCGPASLMMALGYFIKDIELTRALEVTLWKEATLVFMSSGYSGTDGYGLALSALSRELRGEIVTSMDQVPMLRSVRSSEKREVMKLIHDDMKKKAKQLGFGSSTYQYDIHEIISAIHRDMIPLVLISTYRLTGDKVPHWVVVTGFDEKYIYIHDSDLESYDMDRKRAKNIRLEKTEFLKMTRYGKEVYRCLLLIGR